MPIAVTELDPPAKDSFEPFAMRVDVTDLEQLRELHAAMAAMTGKQGVPLRDFLKSKLQRYERVG